MSSLRLEALMHNHEYALRLKCLVVFLKRNFHIDINFWANFDKNGHLWTTF